MCPSYRATLDEKDSTARPGQRPALRPGGRRPARTRQTACARMRERWRPRGLRSVPDVQGVQVGVSQQRRRGQAQGRVPAVLLSRPASAAGPSADGRPALLQPPRRPASPRWSTGCRTRAPLRWLLEKTAGIDRRRSLPPLHADHFRRWFRRSSPAIRRRASAAGCCCWPTASRPTTSRRSAESAVRVLERAGYRVELADLFCCGRIADQQGVSARGAGAGPGAGRPAGPAHGRRHAASWAWSRAACSRWPTSGPNCCPARTRGAWPRRPRWPTAGWPSKWPADSASCRCVPREEKCVLHGHCHQKALLGVAASGAAAAAGPGAGRAGARRGLLRHGGVVRLRERTL